MLKLMCIAISMSIVYLVSVALKVPQMQFQGINLQNFTGSIPPDPPALQA